MHYSITFSPPLDEKAAAWRRLAETGIYEGLGRLAQDAGDVLLTALQDEAPLSTGVENQTPGGAFRESIRQRQLAHYGGGLTLEYVAADPLARFIIEGTQPHIIRPVNGKVLHFISADGDEVFTREVHHPGTLPNDFPARAWESSRSEIEEILRRTGRELIESVQ